MGATKAPSPKKVRPSAALRGCARAQGETKAQCPHSAPPSPPSSSQESAPGATGPAPVNPGSLDDYDPKVQAEKEREALVAFVSAKRTDASRLQAEVGDLARRYESAKIDLAQLAYEDDVDVERQQGLRKMSDLKARIVALDTSLEDTEAYQRSLGHMIKRGQEEKLSHLGTLKAFEDAIRVHRHELELSDGVLRQVNKSRDDELAQLHRMQQDVRKYLGQLDRKLEARRLEVKASREKAADRMKKMRAEAAMKAEAEGDMTAEQERQLIETAKNQQHEAAELRAEKIRVQAEADAAETEFIRVRFSAGVPQPGGGEAVVTEEGQQFPQPDPEPIIQRFAQLEDEVKQIEEQLADWSRRLNTLQQQKGALAAQNQPRAVDALDEEDVDVNAQERQHDRAEVAKRSLETAMREFEEARQTKLQLEQSINVLMERLTLLAPGGGIPAVNIDDADSSASALLRSYSAVHPTAWGQHLQSKTVAAVMRVQSLMRSIDPTSAAASLANAAQMLQSSMAHRAAEAAGQSSPRPMTSSSSRRHGGEDEYDTKEFEGSGAAAAAAAAAAATGLSHEEAGMDAERRLEATIESLVVRNEWSIRVRPGSSGPQRPVKNISTKTLTDASSAFAETFKQVNAGTFVPEPGSPVAGGYGESSMGSLGATGAADPFSKEAVRQRRRDSRIELNAAFAAAAAAQSGHEEDASPRGAVSVGGRGDGGGDGRSDASTTPILIPLPSSLPLPIPTFSRLRTAPPRARRRRRPRGARTARERRAARWRSRPRPRGRW
jgi:hypothetical protein